MKQRNMDIYLCLMLSALLGFTNPFPQRSNVRLSDIDISSAQEINNLEPSAIPGIESRSFSSINSGNYVEATVEEVQNIIKSNPDLPRLTRGEILDLLENITRDDMEKLRRLNSNRKGKAILLVMPYSAKRNGETMEDLFTKRPVTQLIDTDNSSSEEKTEEESRKPVSNSRNEIFRRGSVKTEATTTYIPPTEETEPSSTFLTTVLTTRKSVSYRSRTRPPRTRPPTTPKPSTTTRPFRRRRITTTTHIPITTFHNHRYSDENTDKFLPENAMRSTRPYMYRISRRTTTAKPDLNVAESYVDNSYVKYGATQGKERYESKGNIPYQQHVHPNNDQGTSHMSDEIKNPQAIFKPLPSQTRVQLDSLESSHDSFQQETADIAEESPEFDSKELFKPSTITSQNSKSPSISPEDYIIPDHLKYVIDDLKLKPTLKKGNFLKEAVKRVTVFPRTTSTSTEFPITPMPEFKEVADNLSPEMKNLLMTFGLLPSKEAEEKGPQQSGYYPEKPEDKPESYTGFKPLPEEGEADKEMDALLASFGLGRSARKGRKVKKEVRNEQLVDFSVIPNSMMDIVQNLGLSKIAINKVHQDRLRKTETSKRTEISVGRHQNDVNETDKETPIMRRTDELSNSIENGNSIGEESHSEYPSKSKDEDNTKMAENENHGVDTTEPAEKKFLVFAESETNTTEANTFNKDMQTTKDTLTSVVFNPTDQKIVEHEKEQLDKLMELMKALKAINGSATEEDFKNIDLDTLKQFTEVLNNSQRLTVGEQLSMSEEEQKMHSTSTEIFTVIPAETQNEIESDSQVLEESFGGLQGTDTETEPPEPKKLSNGLYYLIDWNTFLEVDDTKGRRVNLRFQPKVGDPNRFYSIHNN
ncbi:hypothetical protein WA026_006190 [Henosepilachna vigintioctopunctata]|uniref:Uncharacterized protein n=1 Tax=Henosepilachna vigintioctopunctata TaxID=420089 RepID=A0AAW1TPJ3_9CUCU